MLRRSRQGGSVTVPVINRWPYGALAGGALEDAFPSVIGSLTKWKKHSQSQKCPEWWVEFPDSVSTSKRLRHLACTHFAGRGWRHVPWGLESSNKVKLFSWKPQRHFSVTSASLDEQALNKTRAAGLCSHISVLGVKRAAHWQCYRHHQLPPSNLSFGIKDHLSPSVRGDVILPCHRAKGNAPSWQCGAAGSEGQKFSVASESIKVREIRFEPVLSSDERAAKQGGRWHEENIPPPDAQDCMCA